MKKSKNAKSKDVSVLSLSSIDCLIDSAKCDVLVIKSLTDLPSELEERAYDVALVLQGSRGLDQIEVLSTLSCPSSIPRVLCLLEYDEISEVMGIRAGACDVVHGGMARAVMKERIMAAGSSKDVLRKRGQAEMYIAPKQERAVLVDKKSQELIVHDQRLQLSKTEAFLLDEIVSRPGCAVTRDELNSVLSALGKSTHPRSVDCHIKRIRRRLARENIGKDLIKTIYGSGYKLSESAGH